MTDTTTVPIDEDDLSVVAAFLLGEGPLQGVWYGERPEGERGKYWWRKHLRAAIASAAQEAAVPPGYALVPVEPTDEMLKSGDEKTWVLPARDCWRAMLAAAPKAEPAQPERVPLTEEQLREMHHIDEFGLFCDFSEFEQIARAIEFAHGIGIKKGEGNGN